MKVLGPAFFLFFSGDVCQVGTMAGVVVVVVAVVVVVVAVADVAVAFFFKEKSFCAFHC